MDTRGFKLCAAAVGILPVTAGCTDRAPQEHPNILFILSDDHTSQSWGIYGGILAPYAANDNIARLAAEGYKFTRDSRENLLYMLIECSLRKEDGT